MYFSAVEKTRASESLQLLGTIAKSQQRYKLQSQEYSDNMDNLDITVRDYATGENATGSEFDSQYFDFNLIGDGATSSRKDGDYVLGVDYDTNAIYCGGNDTSICYKLGITDIREISSGSSGADYRPCNGAYATVFGGSYEPAECEVKDNDMNGHTFKTQSRFCYEGFGCYRQEIIEEYDQNNVRKERAMCEYYTPNGGEEVLNTNCTKVVYIDGFSYDFTANERTPDSDYEEYPRYITDSNGCQLIGGTGDTHCYVSNTMMNFFNSNCSNITSAGIYELCP